MEIDDVLGAMDNKPQTYNNYDNNNNNKYGNGGYNKGGYDNKPKGPDLYKKTDWKPLDIDVDNLKSGTKTFLVSGFNHKDDIPTEVVDTFVKVASSLFDKGYKLRYNGDNRDPLLVKLAGLENANVEAYLPWKKYNEDITNPIAIKGNEVSYRLATKLNKKFLELRDVVRAIISSQVMSVLGLDGITPVDFMLIYTPNGAEGLGGNVEFKDLGFNIPLYLKIAENANITVFNLKKDNALSRLKTHLTPKEEL